MNVSSTRKATMYSFTRCVMDSQEAAMQNGMRKAVNSTNGMEMPSTPSLYVRPLPSHARCSTS
jgi:hypothetical protein